MPYAELQDLQTYRRSPKERQRQSKKAKKRWARMTPEQKQIANVAVKAHNQNLKNEMIEAYGGVCTCCGETASIFLTIDHIDGSGAKDRANGLRGANLYRKLRREGWPKDNYRILCFNCNIAVGVLGSCPHLENPGHQKGM